MKNFKEFIKEEYNRPIGTKKIFKNIHNDPNSFYNKRKMMGHTWSSETMDMIENQITIYSKTKLQKWLINEIYGGAIIAKSDDSSWHIFNRFSKKYIALIQYVLRRIDKKQFANLLSEIEYKSGLSKEKLNWAFEYLAYKYDRDVYEKNYISGMSFYGMKPEEAKKTIT